MSQDPFGAFDDEHGQASSGQPSYQTPNPNIPSQYPAQGDSPYGSEPPYGSAGAGYQGPEYGPGSQQPNGPGGYGQQPYGQPGYGQYQQPYGQPPYGPGYQQGYGYGPYGPSYPPPVPGAKSRLAAGLLGIFLGSLGIHRFYLGYTGMGLTMLLLSVLSLGILAPVIGIWGLIEGIVYLTAHEGSYSVDAQGRPLTS